MTFKVKDGISVAGSTFVDGSRNTTTNNLTVGGNLTVSGTTTTINTATLEVADLNITVAKNATTAAAANGAGLTVAGASATLLYTSAADSWNFNKNVFASNLSGTNTGDNAGVTSVAAVTPIVSSGGTTPSISHATSGVGAGTYNNVTVNTFGHVTSGSNTAYLTTLTDTLATVTGRGATTTTAVILNGGLSTGSASTGVTRAVVDTGGNFLSYYAAETTARIQLGRDVGISGGAGLALGGALYALIASSDTNGSALYFKLNTAAATASTSPNMSLTSTGLSVAGTLTASNLSGTNTGDNPGVTSVAGVTPIVSSGGTTPSISHATSGVGAGTYNNVTVNTFGHVTAGSNVGYISGYTEVDTLATVTARGASTSTSVTLSGTGNQFGGHFYFLPYDAAGNHYPHFNDGGSASGTKINWRLYTGVNNTVTHTWTTSLATFATNIAATNFSGSSSGTNTGDNPGVTSVAGVTPIVSSGGTTPSISHATSGVGAGTYNNVTVNTFGHVTAGSNTAYLTALSDTLATVTARGNTTTTAINSNTGAAINLVTAGNQGAWLGGFNDATTGWALSKAVMALKPDDATYSTIGMAGTNGLLYFARTSTGAGTLTSWLEVSSAGVANFKLARPQWNGTNLVIASDVVSSIAATSPIVTSAATGGVTLSHATSGVGAGTYNNVTVNTFGHVTAGSNVGYVSSSGVTSVATSGGYGGLTLTGGTITTTGTITMGGTPTGTWPISVSGTAANATTLLGSGVITYGASGTQWLNQSGVGGAGTNGVAPSNPTNDWYHHLIFNHANNAGYYVDFAACFHSDTYAFRRVVGGVDNGWKTLWHSGNLTNLNQLTNGPGYGTGTVTAVTATTPIISSGGTTPNITHATSGATAGTYNNVTVNTFGHVTAGSNVGYLTAEADTLATVTARGNVASGGIGLPAGDGIGYTFWGNGSSYKISMGVGTLYQYGTVTDYSIKMQMDTGSTGRGFTWGRDGVTPVAGLNSTSGNFQTAGTIAASNFSGSSSGTNTGDNAGVTSVTGTAPVVSSGGTTPAISMAAASASVNGYLTSANWTTFNNKIGSLTDTLATVTARGATTLSNVIFGNTTGGTVGSSGAPGTALGTIKSARMMGKYTNANSMGSYYMDYNSEGTVTLTDGSALASLSTTINCTANISEANALPAYGTSYGSKNAGMAFISGTQTDILKTVVGLAPTTTGAVNAVLLGYLVNGPRILIQDNTTGGTAATNVITHVATSHNFVGAITQGGSANIHAGNYTSYSPSLTGGSASGTWGISITGSSASTTGNAATASQLVGAAPNGVFRYTPNLHFNSAVGNAVILNWDNGATTGTVQTFRIGNGSSSDIFTVTAAGTVIANGNITAYGTASDITLKENIIKFDNALGVVKQLNGYYFNYIGKEDRLVGVIAQEVEKVLPELVYTFKPLNTAEDKKAVKYELLSAVLIEAIKEQQTIIDSQESRIARLEALVFKLTEGK
jgi:hypothetical protein